MKKSKTITLVLITSALASCHKEQQSGASGSWDQKKVYMRSDTTASYTRTHYHSGVAGALLWYYAFRPYGRYNNGRYDHAGYYSGGLHTRSNTGTNSTKSAIVRGGFGRGGSSVS
ncbi:hypothetical protein [Taibaiella koreensis]|uniref:hypothetical protein n=1 Tax=Taibaiella koreensis TaxID=1268548 RepID=UPI000E59B205|nr:hypothetical protein [Taibaiella koreensis]